MLPFCATLVCLSAAASEPGEEDPASHDLIETYETVVRSQRPPMSAGTVSVTAEEIEKAHPSSTDEILELVQGVIVVQHGAQGKGHQLFLRGFDAAHGSDVEVLLEGISLNEPSHVHGQGYLDLYGIIPEVILEITAVKGPFLPWQGNFATAGSIRFRLGVSDDLRPGLVRTEVSHRGRLRSVVIVASEDQPEETFIAAEAVYDRGFGPDREARRAAFMSSRRRDTNDGTELNALLMAQTARFESPGALRLADVEDGKIDFHGAYGPAGEGLSDRVLARLGMSRDTDGTDLGIFVYGMLRQFSLEENFTGKLVHGVRGDRRRQQQSGGSVGADIELEHKLSTGYASALLAGAGWRLDVLHQREVQVDDAGAAWQTNRDLDAGIQHVHMFTGYRFSPWSWLEIYPSARLDLFLFDARDQLEERAADETEVAISPRMALSFPVHRKVTLFADYGRGFRAPEARAVVAPASTPEDETVAPYAGGSPGTVICDAAEVGAEISPHEVAVFRITGFATWMEREMLFDHVSNTNLEMDGTRRLGVEASTALRPASWLSTLTEVTWSDARFNESGNPVPGAPVWLAALRLFIGEERGPYGGSSVLWIGARPLAHGARVDGYARLDLNAGWRFTHFDVSIIVDNALGWKIMEGAYHYASRFDPTEERSVIPRIHYVAGEPLTARIVLTAYL